MPSLNKKGFKTKRQRQIATTNNPNARGKKKADPFYVSKQWRALRNAFILASPLCEHCQRAAAEMVDHVVPIKVDASKALDASNLQALCHACHAIKTKHDKQDYQM